MNTELKGNNVVVEDYTIMEAIDLYEATAESNHSRGSKRSDFHELEDNEVKSTFLRGNKYTDAMKGMPYVEEVAEHGYEACVSGMFFDVPTVLSGNPEHWFTPSYEECPKTFKNVIVQIGNPHYITTNQMINRGRAIVEGINALNINGVEVEKVILYITTNYNGNKYGFRINIPTQPLDIDSFAFFVAIPDSLRRVGFAMLEKATGRPNCGGYGCACKIEEMIHIDTEDTILIDEWDRDEWDKCKTLKGAREFILKEFEKHMPKDGE